MRIDFGRLRCRGFGNAVNPLFALLTFASEALAFVQQTSRNRLFPILNRSNQTDFGNF
jgi:hypothetical protein